MDLKVKQHDTWPPVRGVASDENGPMNLSGTAVSLKFLAKSGVTLISGTALAIWPVDVDGFNWQYTWHAGDTAILGTYQTELEITWDATTTPPKVETVPNDDSTNPTVTIVADQG